MNIPLGVALDPSQYVVIGIYGTNGWSAFNLTTVAVCEAWRYGNWMAHIGVWAEQRDGFRERWEMQFNGMVRSDYASLMQWKKQHPRAVCETLEMSRDPAKVAACMTRIKEFSQGGSEPIQGYGKTELLWHYGHARLGLQIPDNPRKQTCGEFAGRVLYPDVMDLRLPDDKNFDSVQPPQAWGRAQQFVASPPAA